MQWLSFTKVEKVMLKLQNWWIWTVQRYRRLWRRSRRPETPLTDQGAEENWASVPLNCSKTRGKTFISKEVWPARGSDLSPLNFSIWSILETNACSSSHPTVESLKTKLVKEWAAIPHEKIRAACVSFSARLKAVVKK